MPYYIGSKKHRIGQRAELDPLDGECQQIEFPGFHFRIEDPLQNIVYKQCVHGSAVLNLGSCSWGGDDTNCFRVVTDGIVAVNKWGEPLSNTQIDCIINTSNAATDQNLMIAWGQDPHHGFSSNPYHQSLYLRPDNEIWVLLEKRVAKPEHTDGDPYITFWRRRVHYQSTVSFPGYYVVSTIIESFGVEHLEQRSLYNGWMAMGDVGGFAFFLLILHTIVMLGVGVFLANDSKFLHSDGHEVGSSAEQSPLIK